MGLLEWVEAGGRVRALSGERERVCIRIHLAACAVVGFTISIWTRKEDHSRRLI